MGGMKEEVEFELKKDSEVNQFKVKSRLWVPHSWI